MSAIQEKYHGSVVGVNTTVTITGGAIGGFLPSISGTLTITRTNGEVIVNALPVTAGTWVRIPLITHAGATVTTAGGAAGTLFVGQ